MKEANTSRKSKGFIDINALRLQINYEREKMAKEDKI